MKIRSCFVANSSSSSFIISLDDITSTQAEQIKNHITESKNMDNIKFKDKYDAWNISINLNKLTGSTYMDNFDMETFLDNIGVNLKKVTFKDF